MSRSNLRILEKPCMIKLNRHRSLQVHVSSEMFDSISEVVKKKVLSLCWLRMTFLLLDNEKL